MNRSFKLCFSQKLRLNCSKQESKESSVFAATLLPLALLLVVPTLAYAQEDGYSSEEVEGNPVAPSADPNFKRKRAVPLPGKGRIREERTGQVETLEPRKMKNKEGGSSEKGTSLSAPEAEGKKWASNDFPAGNIEKPRKNSFSTTQFPTRLIFLNGRNISSLKDEVLENVTVRIDAQGNIQIDAPHYEVNEQSSYHPLLPSELPRYPKNNMRPRIPALDELVPSSGDKFSKDSSDWVPSKSPDRDSGSSPRSGTTPDASPRKSLQPLKASGQSTKLILDGDSQIGTGVSSGEGKGNSKEAGMPGAKNLMDQDPQDQGALK